MNKYGVIMAGGGGTRFWPLSRQKTPKQLLNLTGKELMINETIERLEKTVDGGDIFIVTNRTQCEPMLAATEGRIKQENILAEPCARNTAACVGYAAITIAKKFGDGIMVITPSDAYIRDTEGFTKVLSLAASAAEREDRLVTIGITPTFPATGYGYIKYDKNEAAEAKQVEQFKEKPDFETALAYLKDGSYAWNSGMFIWKASTILEKFEKLVPDIYADLMKIGDAIGTENEAEVINAVYPEIRKISVDYAIMEPAAAAGDVLVVPGDFGWSDVGSWDMMNVLHESDENGNVVMGDALLLDTKDSVICAGNRMVTTLGLENMVVVETADSVMVCRKDRVQDIRLIVAELEKKGRTDLL